MLRPATALFREADLLIQAETDVVAGGQVVTAARLRRSEVADVRAFPLSADANPIGHSQELGHLGRASP